MSQKEGDIKIVPSKPNKYAIQARKVDVGVLGRIFGSRENAPTNIAGLLLFTLIIAGVIALLLKASISAADFWDKIVPILTLLCGYLFGKKF
jgi:gamma-glutamyl phosphate reductase